MDQDSVLKLFEKHGALLNGHFKLSSGLHSERYLQCALVLQHPDLAGALSEELAGRFCREGVDVVVGPALGGVTFAYEVARALGVRGIFTERSEGRMVLRRGFSIKSGERALVVEDVITTGGSTKEVIEVVKEAGGRLAGVGCIIDRSETEIEFGARKEHLAKVRVATYDPDACPLCKSGMPVVKPGSRK